MSKFYGFISNWIFTWFIIGSINHLYFKRYKYKFWKTYAYIAGAAADTGFNLNMLVLFIAFSAVKVTVAPHWVRLVLVLVAISVGVGSAS
uniref:OPT oligopeptide transporter n=1 Tax=Mycena chlorophos TaxID=658473 RepID=A0ABQ0LIX0_MYCCL|nr:OPT oligopeptide transporter [Mycena chlorophos]